MESPRQDGLGVSKRVGRVGGNPDQLVETTRLTQKIEALRIRVVIDPPPGTGLKVNRVGLCMSPI
ncbi:MAG: hypothetical protein ACLQJR_20655 [Stellaceae bacterium]